VHGRKAVLVAPTKNAHGLERLETQAVEVERVLNQLQRQIDRYRTLPPIWVREPSLADH
jgi:hypothetical protein